MINLLPNDYKAEIHFARRNSKLRNWILAALLALLGLAAIVAGGWLYLSYTTNTYSKDVEEMKKNLAAQNVDQTQKEVEEISSDTKLAVQVLSKEVLFSKLLPKLSTSLPPGTSLNTLQIDKLQGGIQLSASAADFNAATQLQINLQDPKNGIFEKADINSINCGLAGENRDLPCDVSLRVLFLKNNPFIYISPTGSEGQN